jgi:hypothetical protein
MNLILGSVFANGIYDILCGLSILNVIKIPILNTLHTSMFKKNKSETFKKSLAYYILINGVVRVGGGCYYTSISRLLLLSSYLLETALTGFETYISKSVIKSKGNFVIVTSLLFVYFLLEKKKT